MVGGFISWKIQLLVFSRMFQDPISTVSGESHGPRVRSQVASARLEEASLKQEEEVRVRGIRGFDIP